MPPAGEFCCDTGGQEEREKLHMSVPTYFMSSKIARLVTGDEMHGRVSWFKEGDVNDVIGRAVYRL